MKLRKLKISQDLKNIKNTSHPHDITSLPILLNSGWRKMGSGMEAIVMGNPKKPYVLKLVVPDSKYTYFVNMVQQYPDNPHFPKFSRWIKKVPHSHFLYVRMEKLTPIDMAAEFYIKTYFKEMAWMCKIAHETGNVLPGLVENAVMDVAVEKYGIVYDYKNTEDYWDRIFQQVPEPDSSWKTACKLLIKTLADIPEDTSLDVYDENLMMRKNVLVITDPYY